MPVLPRYQDDLMDDDYYVPMPRSSRGTGYRGMPNSRPRFNPFYE